MCSDANDLREIVKPVLRVPERKRIAGDVMGHQRARAYSWYSPNGGNGFRLDQAFLSPGLLPRLEQASYIWGGGRNAGLSDHAALLVDLA